MKRFENYNIISLIIPSVLIGVISIFMFYHLVINSSIIADPTSGYGLFDSYTKMEEINSKFSPLGPILFLVFIITSQTYFLIKVENKSLKEGVVSQSISFIVLWFIYQAVSFLIAIVGWIKVGMP